MPPSHHDPTAEREERQEEGTCRERDRQAEYDLDQPPKPSRGVAKRQRQTGDDDDDDSQDLGDGTLDGLQDLIERLLPGHVRTGSPGGNGDQHLNTGGSSQRDAAMDTET